MKIPAYIWLTIYRLSCICCIACTSRDAVWAQKWEQYTVNASVDTAQVSVLIKASLKIKLTQPDSALALAREALNISRHSQNKRHMVGALITVGTVLSEGKNDFKLSKTLLFEAMKISGDLPPDDNLLSALYLDIGNVYFQETMYDSACHFYLKALQQIGEQKNKDTVNLILSYNNLGNCYTHKDQFEQALYYLHKAYNLASRTKDTAMLAYTTYATGNVFNTQKNNDSATKYMQDALHFFLKINHVYNAIETYAILGQLFQDKSDFVKAEQYYDSAINLDKKELKHQTTLLFCLGKLNYEKKNYGKAALYFEQSLKHFDQKIHRGTRLVVYQHLGLVYQKLKNYKQAYAYQNDYIGLWDSIQKEKTDNAINQLEVKYRTSEKDKELITHKLELAKASNRLKSNNMWTIGSVSLSLLLIVSGISFFQKQRMRLQKARINSQQLQMAQLKAAIDGEEKERSRIGRLLHDDIMVQLSVIKMGLNALPIKYEAIKHTEDYRNLLQQLNYTSQSVRQTAHNLMPDAILADGLISAVSYFCNDIMKFAQFQISIQYYGSIIRLSSEIEVNIYRIIQELIQNIIKHAKANNVIIQFNFRPNVLSITIEDDGIGFIPEEVVKDNKMGLKSIYSRMQALNAHFDIHQRQPHGTSVNITLNI